MDFEGVGKEISTMILHVFLNSDGSYTKIEKWFMDWRTIYTREVGNNVKVFMIKVHHNSIEHTELTMNP